LYNTVFTNPTKDHDLTADTTDWSITYNLLHGMFYENEEFESLSYLKSCLVVDSDETYLSWLLCALVPWTPNISPHRYVQQKRAPKTLAALVAREGLKIDNRGRDIIDAAVSRLDEVIALKDSIVSQPDIPASPTKRKREPVSREDLGMILHSWGPSWRTSVIMGLLVESLQGKKDRK
jgi:hypothetical protein